MPKMSAAGAAAMRLFCVVAAGWILANGTAAKAEWNEPWKDKDRALVIDAYEFNPISWKELAADKRIAGFINKASDGLPPDWSCRGLSGDEEKLCKNRWWKYSVTQELYMTRREMAKTLGLEWGAYHLGRPGNPREQADHFIDFAKPDADDLIALDIEDNSEEWMSLADAEVFAQQIKIRLGRYPVLYTNGSTAEFIARHKADYPLLSRLPLWYARYRDDITGLFPEDNWPSYALWQFSSMHNCNKNACPYRVKGAKTDIDVNVSPLTVAELRKVWPFAELVGSGPVPAPGALIAGLGEDVKDAVRTGSTRMRPDATRTAEIAEADTDSSQTAAADVMVAAYGPARRQPPVDPLQLLTEVSREEQRLGGNPAPAPLGDRMVASLSRQAGPAVPSAEAPTTPVIGTPAALMVRTLAELQDAMRTVREILERMPLPADPLQPAAGAADSRTAPETTAVRRAADMPPAVKSRLVAMMRQAEKGFGAALRPARQRRIAVEAAFGLPVASRGSRLQAERSERSLLAGVAAIDQRVSHAFHATR